MTIQTQKHPKHPKLNSDKNELANKKISTGQYWLTSLLLAIRRQRSAGLQFKAIEGI
jgi:hypothetical protein